MRCPLCPDSILDARHHGGIEIDVCPRCKGVWLDRGELDRLIGSDAPTTPARRATDPVFDPAMDDPDDEAGDGRDRRGATPRDRRSRRSRRLAERLGDLLDEVLDL